MDPCHYNFPSLLICHYNSPISNRAITISHFFQTYHYVPLRRVSENLWTKIPSSSSSSHSSLFSFLPPSPWPRQIRPRQAMWGPPPASAALRPWPALPPLGLRPSSTDCCCCYCCAAATAARGLGRGPRRQSGRPPASSSLSSPIHFFRWPPPPP